MKEARKNQHFFGCKFFSLHFIFCSSYFYFVSFVNDFDLTTTNAKRMNLFLLKLSECSLFFSCFSSFHYKNVKLFEKPASEVNVAHVMCYNMHFTDEAYRKRYSHSGKLEECRCERTDMRFSTTNGNCEAKKKIQFLVFFSHRVEWEKNRWWMKWLKLLLCEHKRWHENHVLLNRFNRKESQKRVYSLIAKETIIKRKRVQSLLPSWQHLIWNFFSLISYFTLRHFFHIEFKEILIVNRKLVDIDDWIFTVFSTRRMFSRVIYL